MPDSGFNPKQVFNIHLVSLLRSYIHTIYPTVERDVGKCSLLFFFKSIISYYLFVVQTIKLPPVYTMAFINQSCRHKMAVVECIAAVTTSHIP